MQLNVNVFGSAIYSTYIYICIGNIALLNIYIYI